MQGYSKTLKFVSMLLVLAMLITSQTFVIFATEAVDNIQSDENTQLHPDENGNILETEALTESFAETDIVINESVISENEEESQYDEIIKDLIFRLDEYDSFTKEEKQMILVFFGMEQAPEQKKAAEEEEARVQEYFDTLPTTAKYEAKILNMKQKGKTFSTLTDDEKGIIAEYLGSEAETIEPYFLALEEKSYNIFDSVLIVQIINEDIFTLDEAIHLYGLYSDRVQRDINVKAFKRFAKSFSKDGNVVLYSQDLVLSEVETKINNIRMEKEEYISLEALETAKQLFLDGYTAKQIRAAYSVAATFDMNPTDLLVSQNILTAGDEDDEGQLLLSVYPIALEPLKAKLSSKKFELSVMTDEANSVLDQTANDTVGTIDYTEVTKQVLTVSSALYSVTSDEVELETEPVTDNGIRQPFEANVSEREQVNLNSGALQYSESLISIPGINGTSLDLKLSYDSSESNLSHYSYTSRLVEDYGCIFVETVYVDLYEEPIVYSQSAYIETYDTWEDAVEAEAAWDGEYEVVILDEPIEDSYYESFIWYNDVTHYWADNPPATISEVHSNPAPHDPIPVSQNGYSGELIRGEAYIDEELGTEVVGEYAPGRTKYATTNRWAVEFGGYLYKTIEEGYLIYDVTAYDNSHRKYRNNTVEQTHNEQHYDIGSGWSFNIPSIDTSAKNTRLILPGKGTYALNGNTIKDYDLKDMVLTGYTGYNNGQFSSSKKLTFADGTVYYFNSNGLLLAEVDRFGNTVTYKYATVDGEYHPSEIIDTAGRTITIAYATVDTGKTVTITAPDGSETILHIKALDSEVYGEGNSVLEKIVYPDGETTTFDYEIKDGKYSFTNSTGGSTIQYALLNNVSYNTGSELHYAYEMRDTDLGSGHLNIYRIIDRYTLDATDDNKVIDKTKYSYTYDYSMERTYKTKVTEISTSGEISTEYTFNKDHLCTDKILYDGDTKKQQVETSYHSTYDLPTKVVTTVYGESGNEMETTELYTYDKFGNVLTHISPKAGGSTSNTEYRTTNTYSISISSSAYTGHNIPLTVTYKQDADTTVKVENILSADKKKITQTNTYVNNVLKSKVVYTYDEQGRIVTETSYPDLSIETGIVKTYTYSDGNLESVSINNVVGNDGVSTDITTSYTYDDMGRVLTITDANANSSEDEVKPKTVYTYDNRGRTTKVINPDGSYTEYIYDIVNNITTVNHSFLDAVTYDYDSIGHIETTRYADGTVVTECFYDENGRLIAEATNHGSSAATTTYYAYDVFDRVTEKVVYDVNNALVYRETYEYNDVYTSTLSLVTKTVHGDENAVDIVTKTYINKHGETVKEDIGGVVTEYAYDYVGNAIRVFYDDTTLAAYTYDHNGNILTETNALEDTRTITYDALGRKISESDYKGNVTSYTYDNAGRILTMTMPFTDSTDSVVKYYYDANGNVVKQQQTAHADNSTEAVWRTVEYEYDCMNRVTDIINYVDDMTTQYTHYSYDEAGNLTDVYTGLTQPWSAVLSPDLYSHIEYTYDGRGNNISLTDALGQNETYQYDVLATLTTSTLREGTEYDYTYNPFGIVADIVTLNGKVVSEHNKAYTATGAVRSVTLDGVTVSYTYDGLGNVLTETEGNVVKTYSYDNRGRKSGYTLTIDGEQITSATYSYDLLDRLTSVTEGGITTTYTYDANGNRASQTVDSVITTYSYNDANLVTELTNKLNGTVISHFAYTYYTDGNMRTKAETFGEETTSNTTYLYDGIGRLTSEETDGVAITYEYDANNNRVKMTNAGVVTTYTYDVNNRLLTETTDGIPTTYTYDANGNMLSAVTHLSDTHTFVGGVCTVCGDPAKYMLGDMNGDGDISLLDVLRIMKLNAGQTQSATYGLETAQTFDSEDLDQNGVVDVDDYWLFLEITIGYNRAATMSVSEDASDVAFADVDGNGTVDTADYTIALAEYNEPSDKIARLAADVNGDGEITYDDFDLTLHHVLNDCVCAVGSIANNTSTCTSEKVYTYNARGQQTGYTASASGDFSHTFTDGVCTLCGEAETYMLGDADGNGVINFLDFLISMRYYTDVPETLPPKDLDGDGVAGRKDYLIFAREFAGVGEDYFPDLFAIDELLAFADVSGDGEVGATDYLIAYATYYEKEISECLTNGISLQTSMKAADINGDGEITEADKDIGIDYALNGNDTYPIGEMVDNTVPCRAAIYNSAVTAQYAYNPSGLRNAKTVGGSTKYFVYNGMNIVFEYEDSISDGTIYYYGLNRTHNSNGEIYVYNAHGDTVQLVKNNAVVVSYTYDAFGNLTSQVGESDNPFLYCSEYFDEETGTYYLRARYYNPAYGRFTQQDAWAFMDVSDPLSLNLYTYCGNNPIMYVDPSGHAWYHWVLGAVVVVACAAAVVVTAGGATGAIVAVTAVANGAAAATTASTVAAGAFVGSATVYTASATYAVINSSTESPDQFVEDFCEQGNWGTVAGTATGAVVGGAYGYELSKTSPKTSDRLVFGSDTKSKEKLASQMTQRGWTQSSVKNTVDNPYTTRTSINKATGNSATVYYNKSGSYVIVDDKTNAIVQVSDNVNPSTWIPDSSINNPYRPNK